MVLFAVSRGQAKPAGSKLPKIDWSHQLANGLLFYGYDTGGLSGLSGTSGQNLIDLATGAVLYTAGAPLNYPALQATPYGVGMVYTSNVSNNLFCSSQIRAATAAGNYTFACAFIQTGTAPSDSQPFLRTAGNNSGPVYINWGFDINPSNAGQTAIRAGVNNNGGYQATSNATFSGNNAFVSAVGTLAGGAGSSTLTLYLNAASAAVSVPTITPASYNTNDNICFGTTTSAGTQNPFLGLIFYGAFWSRVLTQAEILQLHLDPYCFLLFDLDELPAVPRAVASSTVPARYWGIRGTIDNGCYANNVQTGTVGFYAGVAVAAYPLALKNITMATSTGGANLCTNTANANATSYANPSNVPANGLVGQSNQWTAQNTDHLPIWWYDFGSPVTITEISFASGSYPPPAFCLVASTNASTWTVVQPFGVPAAWGATSQTFDTAALGVGQHYFWGIQVSNSAQYTQISDVAFALTPGGADISNNPNMAGSNSTANSSNIPAYASDASPTSTQWSSWTYDGTKIWFYAFPTPTAPAEVRVTVGNTTYAPTALSVVYSDDGTTWTVSNVGSPGPWTVGVAQSFATGAFIPPPVSSQAMVMVMA